MSDADCVEFLQWALPRLGMRWPGFRRVRGQVRKRLARRLDALGLPDLAAYRELLERRPSEWGELDSLCRISISRFYRDRAVFECLAGRVLPEIAGCAEARGRDAICCWSAGCASGEEVYTLKMLWEIRLRPRFPDLRLEIQASDADEGLVRRARNGCYRESSLRELPPEYRSAFESEGGLWRVRARYREGIEFQRQDVREQIPAGPFDLVLCRNLVFTYFDFALQREFLERIAVCMRPGAGLVVGSHESLPAGVAGFSVWEPVGGVYRRSASAPRSTRPAIGRSRGGGLRSLRAKAHPGARDGSRWPAGPRRRPPR